MQPRLTDASDGVNEKAVSEAREDDGEDSLASCFEVGQFLICSVGCGVALQVSFP